MELLQVGAVGNLRRDLLDLVVSEHQLGGESGRGEWKGRVEGGVGGGRVGGESGRRERGEMAPHHLNSPLSAF